MMAYPLDDAQTILPLQIDHARVSGHLAAHWSYRDFNRPKPFLSGCRPPTNTILAGGSEMKPATLNDKGFPLDYHDGSLKYLGRLRLDRATLDVSKTTKPGQQ
jgi:hypothetical protein